MLNLIPSDASGFAESTRVSTQAAKGWALNQVQGDGLSSWFLSSYAFYNWRD